MRRISFVTAVALLSASAAFGADASEFEKALKNGSFSFSGALYGDFTLCGEEGGGTDGQCQQDEDTFGYLNGSLGVRYKSGTASGLTLNAGARGNVKFFEINEDDWDSSLDNDIIDVANITYATDSLTLVLGRQEVALEWLGDYHQAAVAVFAPISELTIVGGYTWKYTEFDYDGPYGDFAAFGVKNKGAGVIDVAYKAGDFTIEPWVYFVPDTANWFGGKVAYDGGDLGVSAAYTVTTDETDGEILGGSGGFLHAQATYGAGDLSVLAGLALGNADSTGGLGIVGENVSPFEDGDLFFENDTMTIYGGASYESGDLTFSGLLGYFDAGEDNRNGSVFELDLIATYAYSEGLGFEGKIINVFGGSDGLEDTDYTSLRVAALFSLN
ncbi:MAG: Opr family porin [Helicobacteraceae bacterium]|jgi:hypothetical protein|nr:Opr family porin [Helicobacteraceae bacterium]